MIIVFRAYRLTILNINFHHGNEPKFESRNHEMEIYLAVGIEDATSHLYVQEL